MVALEPAKGAQAEFSAQREDTCNTLKHQSKNHVKVVVIL